MRNALKSVVDEGTGKEQEEGLVLPGKPDCPKNFSSGRVS
jgi:hypothetical protein